MSFNKLDETVKDREAWCTQSIGSQIVGHDWSDLACMYAQWLNNFEIIFYPKKNTLIGI